LFQTVDTVVNQSDRVKLLIVDDDEDDLYLITDALSEVTRTSYAVTTASSPLLAMIELSKCSFDVIFSDYRLGAVTGVDFINSVRAAGIDTPIILLTGISDHLVDNAALKAGSSDFIPKTAITADVLDRSVRYALAHADRQRVLQSILKNTKSGISVMNADGTESLCNAQMTHFAKLAFGDARNAKQELTQLAYASEQKDIVVGSVVFESHITKLPDGGSILALHDVTDRVNDLRERELAEERIRAIAMQDALTGLPNRLAFDAYLDDCLRKAKTDNSKVAVLLFDFNRFKEVNDLFGHAAGDHILRQASTKIREILTKSEFCARLGGDEFVLIQYGSDQDSALELARRVDECLTISVKWEEKIIEASVTLGVALFPLHGGSRQELLANADLAMYRGKSELERSICIFDAGMDQFIRDRRTLAHDLRHAIQDDQLSLDLQPQFRADTGALVGFEALLRWRCPKRGAVSPAHFIPVAEENGLIIEIDNWVLRRACKLLAQFDWLPRLAVNVSAKAICQPTIITHIRSALFEIGVSASRLELEITETALVHDLNRALHNLRQIKALGISVAMDDFGTGYSSLSLLNSFPFDRIKIDGSFIQTTGNNERADEIFKVVVGLGAALKVPVLAEGIETQQQLQFAKSSGCGELQGFEFGRPMSEHLLAEFRGVLGRAVTLPTIEGWHDLAAAAEQIVELRQPRLAIGMQ
jgi:diguanylate cyclase (GGDEF)-like protein